MFSRKKIAAVSGLICGLAVTGLGVTQAHAATGPGTCSVDLQGNVTCVQKITGRMAEGEPFALPRSTTCQPIQPMKLPVIPLVNNGSTRIGPEVTCIPDGASVPVTSDKSDDGFELPGGLLG